MFQKADPDQMLSSGTTFVRIWRASRWAGSISTGMRTGSGSTAARCTSWGSTATVSCGGRWCRPSRLPMPTPGNGPGDTRSWPACRSSSSTSRPGPSAARGCLVSHPVTSPGLGMSPGDPSVPREPGESSRVAGRRVDAGAGHRSNSCGTRPRLTPQRKAGTARKKPRKPRIREGSSPISHRLSEGLAERAIGPSPGAPGPGRRCDDPYSIIRQVSSPRSRMETGGGAEGDSAGRASGPGADGPGDVRPPLGARAASPDSPSAKLLERIAHRRGVGITLLRVARQAPLDDRGQPRRDVGTARGSGLVAPPRARGPGRRLH